MFTPQATTYPGFFNAQVKWNGTGNVNLYVYEPSGKIVFFGGRQGKSGYMDMVNRVGNGPERYYAYCNENTLATGTYVVFVEGDYLPTEREAVLQISSSIDGVLATKSVTLQSGVLTNPKREDFFFITVKKDLLTNRYSITLDPSQIARNNKSNSVEALMKEALEAAAQLKKN